MKKVLSGFRGFRPFSALAVTVLLMGGLTTAGTYLNPVNVAYGPAPTTLTATPFILRVTPLKVYIPSVTATLTKTTDSSPIAGQTVTFTAGPTPICAAITNASGVASCNASTRVVNIVLNLGYTATFAGSTNYLPSTAQAGLIS